MVTKAAAGVLFAGLIGTGGVALAKPGWLGMSTQPPSTSLAEDHDYSSKSGNNGEYYGKFGAEYKDKLVGVYGKEANKDGNKGWWEWSFERLKKDDIKEGKFAAVGTTANNTSNIKVTKPYAKDSDTNDKEKALNQVCYAVYKSPSNKITANPNTSSSDEYKESEVWRYCSKSGTKPTTNPQ